MDTFPAHALSRSYTLGTPRWRVTDPGVAAMTLGSGVLRTRQELGQPIYAVDLRLEALTQAEALALWSFVLAHRAESFWWSDPKLGPLSASQYATWEVVFDPAAWPRIDPRPNTHDRYDADMTLIPVLPAVAAETLVAHWKLNDNAANTTVADATGNGNTGTASHNTDTLTTTGKLTSGLDFDTASSRYVSVAHHADLSLTDGGTICLWVKWSGTSDSSGGALPRLIAKSGSYYVRQSTSALVFYPVSTATAVQTASGALVSGQWRHVAVVIAPEGHKIYVDGVDATSVAGDGTMPPSGTGTLVIGAYTSSAGFFDGVLDDVRIYQRPLTALEIAAIYNSGSGTEATIVP